MDEHARLYIALKEKIDKAEKALDTIAALIADNEIFSQSFNKREIKMIINQYYKGEKNE